MMINRSSTHHFQLQHDRRALATYHHSRDPAARAALVARFLPLARHLAWRYHGRGESIDDLVQVASIGLLNAIDRYDPTRGVGFAAFAAPTITGELRHHFRTTWAVRVPRAMQELALRVRRATAEAERELGRPATTAEIAERAGATIDEVLEARQVMRAKRGAPLDAPSGDDEETTRPAETIAATDDDFARVEDAVTLERLMAELDQHTRDVLRLRFWDDLTQVEIAERVGASQMQISRLIKRAIAQLQHTATPAL